MENLKILIVEDNSITAQEVEEQLLEFGYAVTGNVRNSQKALIAFRRLIPDLVIIDINLGNSQLDGIELAYEFNKIHKVPIIYLTTYGDAKTRDRAKPTNPSYFLTKPCNQLQLEVAIDFAFSNYLKAKEPEIKHSLQYHPAFDSQFFLLQDSFFAKKGKKYICVQIEDVLWVEALGANVKIFTEQTSTVITANLNSFYKQINHPFLIRIHRSYLVNYKKVRALENTHLILDKKTLPIGRTYKELVFQRIIRLKSD